MKKKIITLLMVAMLGVSGCASNNTGKNNNGAATENGTGTQNGAAHENGEGTQNGATTENGAATQNGTTTESGTTDNKGTTSNNTSTGNNTANNNNMAGTNANSQYPVENVVITNSADALNRLKEGNKRFVNDESVLVNVTSARRDELKDGQTPYAVVVSCSDSRVTPNIVFNAGLGEIFDIRIAGNIVDSNALGSIEYGVEHLGTPLIVIMGHQSCGAVTAAYDSVTNGTAVEGNINSLVDTISPAIKNSSNIDDAIHANIDAVAQQVADDDIVHHLMQQGKVQIVKAYYALDGSVTFEQYK